MKKIISMLTVMFLVTGLMMVSSSVSYGSSFDHSRGNNKRVVVNNKHVVINNAGHRNLQPSRPYNNVRYVKSNDNSGLYIAGAALGGIILGAVLGSTMSQPGYAATRQTVYNTPYSGSQAYAQPYNYGTSYNQDAPPGQWVTVQGQWANGQWIPAHNVWVPVNP